MGKVNPRMTGSESQMAVLQQVQKVVGPDRNKRAAGLRKNGIKKNQAAIKHYVSTQKGKCNYSILLGSAVHMTHVPQPYKY